MPKHVVSLGGLFQKVPSKDVVSPESQRRAAGGAVEPERSPQELHAECEELRRRIAAIPRATQNAAIRISELEKALLSIRQARDSMLTQVHALTNRLEVAEGRVEEMALERETMECSAERGQASLEEVKREVEELRGLLRTKEEQHLIALAEVEARLRETQLPAEESRAEKRQAEQLASARKKLTKMEERLKQSEERHHRAHSELVAKLAAIDRDRRTAEKDAGEMKLHLEQDAAEREQTRKSIETLEQNHAAEIAELEARLYEAQSRPSMGGEEQRLAEQLASAHRKLAAVDAYFENTQAQQKQANSTLVEKCVKANQARRAAEVAAKQAQKRMEEIAAEQMWTRRDLEETRAEVARLRAQLGRPDPGLDATGQLEQQRQQLAHLSSQLDAARDELRLAWAVSLEASAPPPEAPAVEPRVADAAIPEPLEGKAAREALESLGAILAVITTAEDPTEALELLHSQIQDFAQRTLCAGSLATYRVISVCCEVVKWMRKTPAKIPTMQEILQDTFRMLSRLAECGGGGAEADTADISVYVVDDDLDNCECIAMALDKMGLRTRYASNPVLALEHLAMHPYALIILDVDLGSANGFEVHARLREIPHFRNTPVLFCSGLSSAQAQVEALEESHAAFLSKPYTVHGVGLKALGMIVGARVPL